MPIEDNISQSGSSQDDSVAIKELLDCAEEQVEVFAESVGEYGLKHDNKALVWISGDEGFKAGLKARCTEAVAYMVKLCADTGEDQIKLNLVKTVLTMACGKALAHSYVAYCKADGNDEAAGAAEKVEQALDAEDVKACGELKRLIDATYGNVQITFSKEDDEH